MTSTMQNPNTLSPQARELLACLPTDCPGDPGGGASLPDLASDIFEHPVHAPARPEITPLGQRSLTRALMREIEQHLAGIIDGRSIIHRQDPASPSGHRRRYSLSAAARIWLDSQSPGP